jgi:hypothetical protein
MGEEQDSGSLDRAIATEMASVQTSVSLSQNVLVISEDRLELNVRDGIAKIRASDAWIAPLGIFLSCFAATLTSDFKDRFLVSKEVWHSLFLLASLFSFAWLVITLLSRRGFDHTHFMALIRNSSSKQRRVDIASATVQTLANAELPVTISIQCVKCGHAISPSEDPLTPRICESCGTVN